MNTYRSVLGKRASERTIYSPLLSLDGDEWGAELVNLPSRFIAAESAFVESARRVTSLGVHRIPPLRKR